MDKHIEGESSVKFRKPLIQKEKLGDQVYGVIREMIANFRFQPGKRLNVEQLSRELATSRTPVWEAIARLEQEGLVQSIPNRGVFIPEIDLWEACDLYQVRGVLEGLAARLATDRLDGIAIATLRELLKQNEAMLETGNAEEFNRMDYRFHAVVYDNCGNPVLQETLQKFKLKMGTIIFDVVPVFNNIFEHHSRIVTAFEARDAAAAEHAILDHNAFMRNYCRQLAEEKGAEKPVQ